LQHSQEVLRRGVPEFVVRFPVRDEICDLYILVAHQLRGGAAYQCSGLLNSFSYVQAPMAPNVLNPLPRLD
jgi:hypothetical protein